MKLIEKQFEFTLTLAKLVFFAYENGLTLTVGDAYRDRRVFGKVGVKMGYGSKNSCHKERLAQDYNLFKDGKWLKRGNEPEWELLGEKWESMHPLARWGGRFGDANHFSFEHNGRK